jgi:putative addiction module CopG family antidote
MQGDLDPQLAALIRQNVESGGYLDADEVIREALRLLDEHDRKRLRAELQIGFDQIERGELVDFTPELLDQLVRESEENARNGKPIKDAVKP